MQEYDTLQRGPANAKAKSSSSAVRSQHHGRARLCVSGRAAGLGHDNFVRRRLVRGEAAHRSCSACSSLTLHLAVGCSCRWPSGATAVCVAGQVVAAYSDAPKAKVRAPGGSTSHWLCRSSLPRAPNERRLPAVPNSRARADPGQLQSPRRGLCLIQQRQAMVSSCWLRDAVVQLRWLCSVLDPAAHHHQRRAARGAGWW